VVGNCTNNNIVPVIIVDTVPDFASTITLQPPSTGVTQSYTRFRMSNWGVSRFTNSQNNRIYAQVRPAVCKPARTALQIVPQVTGPWVYSFQVWGLPGTGVAVSVNIMDLGHPQATWMAAQRQQASIWALYLPIDGPPFRGPLKTQFVLSDQTAVNATIPLLLSGPFAVNYTYPG
jgi:hypothetical protein